MLTDLKKDSRPPTSTPKIRRKKNIMPNTELENKIQELLDLLEEEKQQGRKLYITSLNNQEKYMKREKEFKRTLEEYEKLLLPGKSNAPLDFTSKFREKIHKTHQKVQEKIENVQHQTIEFLQMQEKMIVKDLNNELNDYQQKIKELEISNLKHVTSLKKETLHEDIIKSRAKVEQVESRNNFLHKANKDLKIEFKSYENDVNILNGNLKVLRNQNFKLKEELERIKDVKSLPRTATVTALHSQRAQTERVNYRMNDFKYIDSLKRMIELEKKNLRAAKNAYTRELQDRNELESVIRLSMDDVVSSPKSRLGSTRSHTKELKPKNEILQLLYTKAFPIKRQTQSRMLAEVDSDLLIEHLDKNIENIEKLYSQHEELIQINTKREGMTDFRLI